MKRTTKAFLMSFILLTTPVSAGQGGQGNQRADRQQARMERQAARQQNQAQRAERRAAAAERRQARVARQEANNQARASRQEANQARGERRQARAARQQSAQARNERRAERRQTTAARQQVRAERREAAAVRQQQRAERQQRAVERRQERDHDRAQRVIRQQRAAQRLRFEERERRSENALARAAQRQAAVAEQAQRRAARDQRQIAGEQRQAVRHDRIVAREQRQALRVERAIDREQRRRAFLAAQRLDRDERRAFRQQRLRIRQDVRPTWDGPRRFRGLDFDHDGAISRFEWRGNDRSFRNHDWNRDGILSGVEVVPGGRRVARFERFPFVERFVPLPRRLVSPVPLVVAPFQAVDFVPLPPLAAALPVRFDEDHFERVVRVQGFGPVTLVTERVQLAPVDRVLVADRFIALDLDHDRFVGFDEWTGPRPLFRDLDLDDDYRLVDDELVISNPRVRTVTMVDRDRYVAFALLDQDDDGVVAPWEWTGDMDVFFLLDVDGNSVVDQPEYLGLVQARPVPVRMLARGALDLDHDGYVYRSEWVGDPYRFVSLDLNGDGRLKPAEAVAGALIATQL
jgi:hypothetical protein